MTYESKPPSIGLWKNDRGPHASGNCGNIRFVLWENTDKRGDNSPDYRLVMEAPQKREDNNTPRDDRRDAPQGGGGVPDEEIPFMMEWR